MTSSQRLAILGGGNLGTAIAHGLVTAGRYAAADVTVTRRHVPLLDDLARQGFDTGSDNRAAVRAADTLIIAVQPGQLPDLMEEIRNDVDAARHVLISTCSGVAIADFARWLDPAVPVVRAMPNMAITIRQSMTCICARDGAAGSGAVALTKDIFDAVGETTLIDEELMVPATALCACGVAFFLRAVRAASQGGIEIGFHSSDALRMAAQTAKGAAALLLTLGSHPETEIDKVTTPKGCTISGLNEMENRGFSSALIRGIITSSHKAAKLYSSDAV
jgi:pyrroline-5-carboxylate reductase